MALAVSFSWLERFLVEIVFIAKAQPNKAKVKAEKIASATDNNSAWALADMNA